MHCAFSRALLFATAVASIAGSVACSSSLRRFPLREPMTKDPDDTPFVGKPEEYWSPLAWDGIDNTIFRPLTRYAAV